MIMELDFAFADAVQILILYFVIYAVLRSAKGSRFGKALTAVAVLGAGLISLFKILHLPVLLHTVEFVLLYIAVGSVVIFQPELRRALAAIGALRLFEETRKTGGPETTASGLLASLVELSKRRLGALVAIERGISLKHVMDSGVCVGEAIPSPELLISIFTPPLPLHDGGIVIHNGRITAAHCLFPVSNKPDLISGGMRHRAAVGLSEEYDAVVFVVSEETGTISVAHNGEIHRYPADKQEKALMRWIAKALPRSIRKKELAAEKSARRLRSMRRLFEGGDPETEQKEGEMAS